MGIELVLKLLKSNENIKEIKHEDYADEYGFSRIITFNIRGVNYKIEWWSNIMYLYSGEMMVAFYDLKINGFWPNKFKNNLVLRDHTDDTLAVIPLEE